MGTGQRRERGAVTSETKSRGIERGERDAEKKMCSRSEPGFLIQRHRDRLHMLPFLLLLSAILTLVLASGCQGADVDNGARGDGRGVQQCVLNALTRKNNTLGVAAPFIELGFGTAACGEL
ncbi:hypothetical protein PpBr36_08850 [Pyricularia pennisetigena]|uniref:hypothetical protein n=1 Tax=Pyricularia pennisetigena TaxID=1578925 RepID=UPI0011528698|nr:hypothetical protein PpBr36_08850 [Pyricularia pennisetigena]TLS24058.1 hypothetical protein PpBr36_08850 [Pyricularia pennisetigena]